MSESVVKYRIIELLKQGLSYNEIVKEIGCTKSNISYHAKRIGSTRYHNAGYRYDWNEIADYYKTHSYTETRDHFGFSSATWSKAIKRNDIISKGKSNIIPLEKILTKQSNYGRSHLKRRLLETKLLKNKCYKCGLEPIWDNEPLSLQIDHINGIKDDNRLKNLRILCPNCHSQTLTYAGRNSNKDKV